MYKLLDNRARWEQQNLQEKGWVWGNFHPYSRQQSQQTETLSDPVLQTERKSGSPCLHSENNLHYVLVHNLCELFTDFLLL